MAKIPFDEKELTVAYTIPNPYAPNAPGTDVYTFPMDPVENYKNLFFGEAEWMPMGIETGFFCPAVIPDNVARGFVFAANRPDPKDFGGKDMFGIEWEYVPLVGGSMVRPGKPFMEDANEWYDKLVWPDIDSWDWEGDAKINEPFLNNGKANMLWFLNGAWYERLISFMDFEGAAMALIDDDQKQAVKDLFDKTTDLYIKIIDKCCEVYGDKIAGFTVHDDWGAQAAPFFSPAVGEEMIVPYMKRLTDHIKSKGKIAELHSCGKLELQAKNFVKAGWQLWSPMAMNDFDQLFELVGDKLVVSMAVPCDPTASEAEQEKAGEAFVAKYWTPEKKFIGSAFGAMTNACRKGMYKASRQV